MDTIGTKEGGRLKPVDLTGAFQKAVNDSVTVDRTDCLLDV